MNRSLIERAMQRMADQEAALAKSPANRRPATPRPDAVPTLTTLSRDEVARRHADRVAAARTLIDQAARSSTQATRSGSTGTAAESASAPAAASAPVTTPTASTAPVAATAATPATAPATAPASMTATAVEATRPVPADRATTVPEKRPETDRVVRPARVSIPIAAMTRRGFLDPEDKSSTIHQEFRLIKRRLLDNAFGKLRPSTENGRRIMVTSALPAEGKTFCAINLAISIAIGGEHPVLLVDADIARPTIGRQLDLEDHDGLADALGDARIDPRALVLPTDLPGLSLLLAGAHRDQPVDLLASESMTSLLDRLSALYPDHVFVIDTPPLLAVTECRTLAANAGQVLLVVSAGETPRAALQEALSQLEVCDIVGTVLNKSPARPKAPAYYGY